MLMKCKWNIEEISKKKVADFSRSAGGFRTGAWRYQRSGGSLFNKSIILSLIKLFITFFPEGFSVRILILFPRHLPEQPGKSVSVQNTLSRRIAEAFQ